MISFRIYLPKLHDIDLLHQISWSHNLTTNFLSHMKRVVYSNFFHTMSNLERIITVRSFHCKLILMFHGKQKKKIFWLKNFIKYNKKIKPHQNCTCFYKKNVEVMDKPHGNSIPKCRKVSNLQQELFYQRQTKFENQACLREAYNKSHIQKVFNCKVSLKVHKKLP